MVCLTQEGLFGVKIRSWAQLWNAILLPLPLLVAISYISQAGSLAVYLTLWIAASLLLYDEFRWRGVRGMVGHSLDELRSRSGSWLVPWRSIRMMDWNGRKLWFTGGEPGRKISVTFDQEDAPLVERTLDLQGVRFSRRGPGHSSFFTRYWTLVALLFIASQTLIVLAAILPFFPGEKQAYTTVVNSTRSEVVNATLFDQFRVIYTNNVQVAWGGAVPYLGTLAYGIASYNTGRAIQAIALGYPLPTSVVLLSIYLLPHAWIEELSYPITTAAGLLAFTRWRSVGPADFASRLKRGSTKFVLALGGAALSLMIAGLLEVLEPGLGLEALLLWAPVGVASYLVIRWYRRRGRTLVDLSRK
jgi:uncharacterized membrane protein SpoIIM required for sporulation